MLSYLLILQKGESEPSSVVSLTLLDPLAIVVLFGLYFPNEQPHAVRPEQIVYGTSYTMWHMHHVD